MFMLYLSAFQLTVVTVVTFIEGSCVFHKFKGYTWALTSSREFTEIWSAWSNIVKIGLPKNTGLTHKRNRLCTHRE